MSKKYFEDDYLKKFKDDKTLGMFTRLYMSIPYTYLGDLKNFEYTEEELLLLSDYFLFDFKNGIYFSEENFNTQHLHRRGSQRNNKKCYYIVKEMIKNQYSVLSGILFHHIIQENSGETEVFPDIIHELNKHANLGCFSFWVQINDAIKKSSIPAVYARSLQLPQNNTLLIGEPNVE